MFLDVADAVVARLAVQALEALVRRRQRVRLRRGRGLRHVHGQHVGVDLQD